MRLPKRPNMTALCKCEHLFCDHDWGFLARRQQAAGCLVIVDEDSDEICPCENFSPVDKEIEKQAISKLGGK